LATRILPFRPRLRVLVTGASGLIGAELCRLLAARGHAVLAMAGEARSVPGLRTTPWAGQPPRAGTVALVQADLRRALPRGLGGGLDLVIHAAAVTGFHQPRELHRAVNVGGTARILDLAREAGAAFLHVSTAYVCGERDGPVPETPSDQFARFANAYEASKAEAERLVLASGLRFAIARPSIVVGQWETGAIRRFDGLYALLRLSAEGVLAALPAAPHATLDLVPLDHVAGGLLDLAERMEAAAGGVFHLSSGAPVPVGEFCALAADYPGLRAPRLAPDGPGIPEAARPFASYLRRDPRFVAERLRRLSGRACPPVDGGFLRRLVDHALAVGFLRPVLPQRMSG
jgi:nucleoside-diphosphate-sugar epimerase